eukprot:TRINITY_DN16509_c0_g1_i1.p1 TRINITY_DN16509_c0_g1~~TRINITY_DN16509_c0_g1_i1.p1  ORF type:complete len:507 (+),score=132.38 TRINITY_DN16509_c0_g1_i1:71-1522(+)
MSVPEGCRGITLFKTGNTLDELVEAVDDSKVLFGVVKASQTAGGSFARRACVQVVYKGPKVGQVKGSKFMAHKFAVEKFCGRLAKTIASIACEDRSELKDLIQGEIDSHTINDSKDIGEIEFHLGDTQGTKKERITCPKFELDVANAGGYGRCICGGRRRDHAEEAIAMDASPLRRAKTIVRSDSTPPVVEAAVDIPAEPPAETPAESPAEEKQEPEDETVAKPLSAYGQACKDGTPPSAGEVLEIVKDSKGVPYNWALFQPTVDKLVLEDAGSGGVMELSSFLGTNCSDKLLFGLCRVAFGCGRLRRTFNFMVVWQGEKCGGVKAIKLKHECESFMEQQMGEHSFGITGSVADDVSPEAVVAKASASCTVDSGDGDGLSVASMIAAFEEEQESVKQYYANIELKKRAAEDAAREAEQAAAAAEAAAAEEEKRRREEAASAAKAAREAEAAKRASAAESDVGNTIQKLGSADADSWCLFEITP